MREQERLFSAIGNVDEALLERSEGPLRRGQSRRRLPWAAMAACLAVTAAVWAWSLVPEQPAAVGEPIPTENSVPPGSTDAPPRLEAEGQFHLLWCGMELDSPPFSLYFDESAYHLYEPDGLYIIRPNDPPQGMPECQLEIAHLPNTTLDEAVEARRRQSERLYRSVTLMDEATTDLAWGWPENTAQRLLLASNGTDWDDRQADSWFVEDGQGGIFVLTSSYFLEAAEGLGARFYDMVCTFRVETGDAPAWQAALEETAERMITGRSNLEGISVGGISYTVSEREPGLAATVCVKYRSSPEEPYAYWTMPFVYEDSQWRADPITEPQA